MGNFATNAKGPTRVLQICERLIYMAQKVILYTQMGGVMNMSPIFPKHILGEPLKKVKQDH